MLVVVEDSYTSVVDLEVRCLDLWSDHFISDMGTCISDMGTCKTWELVGHGNL